MAVVLSVRDSILTRITEAAENTEDSSISSMPRSSVCDCGCSTIMAPAKPMISADQRRKRTFSPSTKIAAMVAQSGVVKLTWGDKTWLEFRALEFHFETQCIPHWVAWYLHQLPPWVHRILCGFTMAAELIAPFCIFLPRRWRHGGAIFMIALQVGIIFTGNFAFFNWLSIALCLPLFSAQAVELNPAAVIYQLPEQIKWQDPLGASGAKNAVLMGDPSNPGLYARRDMATARSKSWRWEHSAMGRHSCSPRARWVWTLSVFSGTR